MILQRIKMTVSEKSLNDDYTVKECKQIFTPNWKISNLFGHFFLPFKMIWLDKKL